MAVFFLLADHLARAEGPTRSRRRRVVGLLTKVIPVVALPAGILSFSPFSRRLRYAVGLARVSASSPCLCSRSITPCSSPAPVEVVSRASWETVWALLENYYGPGLVPYLTSRFDPSLATWQSHPGSLPHWAITVRVSGWLPPALHAPTRVASTEGCPTGDCPDPQPLTDFLNRLQPPIFALPARPADRDLPTSAAPS